MNQGILDQEMHTGKPMSTAPGRHRALTLWGLFFCLMGIMAYMLLEIFVFTPSFSGTREATIPFGTSLGRAATILKDNGIIRSRGLFLLYTFSNFDESNIQAGHYVLHSMPLAKLEAELVKGGSRNDFVVPEGWTIKDIADGLDKEKTSNGAEFATRAANADPFRTQWSVLSSLPPRASLEGFLFPDTYVVLKTAKPDEVIGMMLTNFSAKITPELRREAAQQDKTVFQIVTMASLIEKEVASEEDRRIVSGILWKRIALGIPLQVDATLAYIKKERGLSSANGKISAIDTKIDSLYNTYKYPGLPHGPISNPGISAIKAALYPKDSPYLYYLSTPEGKTIFSKTLEEHNRAKEKYLK